MGEDLDTGILIESVSAGTSADEGGMQAGDVMLRWDDTELADMGTLASVLRSHKPGDVVAITVRRDGAMKVLNVRLKASGG
jgi:S1-C subfamily serine protease